MKRLVKSFLIISLLLVSFIKVEALSASKNDITIEKGKNESISLYAEVPEDTTSIEFTLVFSTYDIPANFIAGGGYTDTGTGTGHVIKFSEPVSGKVLLGSVNISVKSNATVSSGTISIYNAKATNSSDESTNLNTQNINVKVGESQAPKPEPSSSSKPSEEPKEEPKKDDDKKDDKDNKENNSLLEKIESNIVKIELKKDIYEYTVTIPKDTEELDLKPVAKDSNTKIDITTQKIADLKDNQIIITLKNNDKEEKYTINVKEKKDIEKVTIDNTEFKVDKSYKGKWVLAIIALTVVFLGSLLFTKKK